MSIRLCRLVKWAVLGLLPLLFLTLTNDALHFNPAQEAAAPYVYDLVAWQVGNFLDKWVHRLGRALPWNSLSDEDREQRVAEYFELGGELSSLQSRIRRAAVRTGDARLEVMRLEERAEDVRSRRKRLRNDVEEAIEATISAVLDDEGVASWGWFMFPPVDIRLTAPPKLLITSPRDRILRQHNVLLESDVKIDERERVEDELLEESDLSALVIDIGGLATYPASLPAGRSLRRTLETSAHEWLHHYFFFRPLGQSMFNSSDMQTLNETAADIAGREIGDRAYERLGGNPGPASREVDPEAEVEEDEGDDAFDFDTEMRETRLRVDELLAEGKVADAEAYMEERRRTFNQNGFRIRKLNQAYFAFHGTYAESPTSISPIGDQLHQMRDLVPDLGDFIKAVSGVSSYREFLEELERLRAEAGDG